MTPARFKKRFGRIFAAQSCTPDVGDESQFLETKNIEDDIIFSAEPDPKIFSGEICGIAYFEK